MPIENREGCAWIGRGTVNDEFRGGRIADVTSDYERSHGNVHCASAMVWISRRKHETLQDL